MERRLGGGVFEGQPVELHVHVGEVVSFVRSLRRVSQLLRCIRNSVRGLAADRVHIVVTRLSRYSNISAHIFDFTS